MKREGKGSNAWWPMEGEGEGSNAWMTRSQVPS